MDSHEPPSALQADQERQSGVVYAGASGAAIGVLAFELLFGTVGLFSRNFGRWAFLLLPGILWAVAETVLHRGAHRLGERLSAKRGRHGPGITLFGGRVRGRAARALIAIVLLLILTVVVEKNPEGRAVNVWFLGVAFIAGAITWFWVQGIRQRPPQAARLGATAGAVAGAVYEVIQLLLVHRYSSLGINAAIVVQSAMAWGLVGYAGGTAIERGWFSRAGVRVGAGVAAGIAVFGILSWTFVHPFPWPQRLLIAAGWGVGLLLHRPADAVLEIGSSMEIGAAGGETSGQPAAEQS